MERSWCAVIWNRIRSTISGDHCWRVTYQLLLALYNFCVPSEFQHGSSQSSWASSWHWPKTKHRHKPYRPIHWNSHQHQSPSRKSWLPCYLQGLFYERSRFPDPWINAERWFCIPSWVKLLEKPRWTDQQGPGREHLHCPLQLREAGRRVSVLILLISMPQHSRMHLQRRSQSEFQKKKKKWE